jgi:hypothetical protein
MHPTKETEARDVRTFTDWIEFVFVRGDSRFEIPEGIKGRQTFRKYRSSRETVGCLHSVFARVKNPP